jgi:hypothetical protein
MGALIKPLKGAVGFNPKELLCEPWIFWEGFYFPNNIGGSGGATLNFFLLLCQFSSLPFCPAGC